jgi:hypothetical protein
MKIFDKKVIFPALFIIVGLFYFFEPVISAWFEIVDSSVAASIFLPINWVVFIPLYLIGQVIYLTTGNESISVVTYIYDYIFLFFYLIYLTYFITIIRKNWSLQQKRLSLFPLIAFPLFWLGMFPIGATNIERHINSYSIGGWSRMMFAGGAEIIRDDGIKILENTRQESPAFENLPSAIKKLGGWVWIEQDKQLVLVGIGRMSGMSDEFGFIIQGEIGAVPIPHYIENSQFYKIWKLADGIYFFER